MDNITQDALSQLAAICAQPHVIEVEAETTGGLTNPNAPRTHVAAINRWLAHGLVDAASLIAERLRRNTATANERAAAFRLVGADCGGDRIDDTWFRADGLMRQQSCVVITSAWNIAGRLLDGMGTERDRRTVCAVVGALDDLKAVAV
ncbi:hypothetical protein [Paracoccus sp. (in: a-proteobacteria)]|uniref:hypothetical protein n=1 Tax=Paracoccus sp. TaxID=267 RepID=UPI00272A48F6|nr:hypothetical protein [Paracoccus sp. (in: a-proteobacteria)]